MLDIASAQVLIEKDTTKRNIPDTLKKDLFTAPDTVQHLHSKTRSFIPPAVLVSYGATSFYIPGLRRLDQYVYREANEHDIATRSNLENYFQYTPVVLTYALNLVGVHGKNAFVDRTLTLVLAQSILGITLTSLKHATHRLRPNGADRLSFPSGHTANAFLEAEFMSQELSSKSPVYSVIGYAFATTTGAFRIYHQDHWLSDVIAGAGFGILATKGAYLIYPYIRNSLFHDHDPKPDDSHTPPDSQKKKPKRTALLIPAFENGGFGIQFTMQL